MRSSLFDTSIRKRYNGSFGLHWTAIVAMAISLSLCQQFTSCAEPTGSQPALLPLSKGKVIPLSNGITTLDITGQQSEGMAILAHRENFNAHGFDVLSLYIKTVYEVSQKTIWSIIPVFDGDEDSKDFKERPTINVGGGADCFLHDFRLVRDSESGPLRLIIAERLLANEGYAGTSTVTFSFYELRYNQGNSIGRPVYYFERTGQSKAKRKYCDVEEAFKQELGFGDYRKSSR